MPKISSKEFENLSRLILEIAGIQLEKGKEYLMEARLEPILERYGLGSYNELYNQAISDATGKLKASVVDAITINETYFFRDKSPFELLKNKIIPDIIDHKSTVSQQQKIPLKIWSAACSTGQEVYSLGIVLKEMSLDMDRFDINILGTDISNEAIAKASYGKYNQFEVERGLGSEHLDRYFTKLSNAWKIKDDIRSMARFSQLDLNKSFAGLGSFDIILCRNVAIYFPIRGKMKLYQKLASILNPYGALIVGSSEALAGIAHDFVPRHYLNSVFYQLKTRTPTKSGISQPHPYQETRISGSTNAPKFSPPAPKPIQLAPAIRARQDNRFSPAADISEPKGENPTNCNVTQSSESAQSPTKKPEKESLLEKLQAQTKKTAASLIDESPQKKTKKMSLLEKLNREKKE